MATLVQADPQTDRVIAASQRTEGKVETTNGEVVRSFRTGWLPGNVSPEIAFSLQNCCRRVKRGFMVPDNVACLVDLPNRQSFGPDAGYHPGPDPGMSFFQGTPVFAAEVRSEGDYGRCAERDMVGKRTDYFAAGTRALGDVDPVGEDVDLRVFLDGNARTPAAVFRRGELADAEPAVPGWSLPVDDLFAA